MRLDCCTHHAKELVIGPVRCSAFRSDQAAPAEVLAVLVVLMVVVAAEIVVEWSVSVVRVLVRRPW